MHPKNETREKRTTQMVFYRYNQYAGGLFQDIYQMTSDGTNETQLIANPWNDSQLYDNSGPIYNSDKSKIVFLSTRETVDGNFNIFILDIQSSSTIKIAGGLDHTDPHWSPDDQKIIYSRDIEGSELSQIFMMNDDGLAEQQITNIQGRNTFPVWSPTVDKIAFVNQPNPHNRSISHIWIMNPDGSSAEQITSVNYRNDSPSWSPDGSHIAFQSWRDGRQDVFKINLATKNVQNLTDTTSSDLAPSWSDLGIAFCSNRNWSDHPTKHDIFIMDENGTNPQDITSNEQNEFMGDW